MLVELLARRDRRALERLGSGSGRPYTLRAPVDVAGEVADAVASDDAACLRAQRVLVRLGRVAPGCGARAGLAAAAPPDWWRPADIEAPSSDEPRTATPGRFARADLDRVLRDLS